MADYNTKTNYTGDGTTTDFAIPFDYLSENDVVVTVNGASTTRTFVNPNLIRVSPAPASGALVLVQRVTDLTEPTVSFNDGSVITAPQLNAGFEQTLFAAQEANDLIENAVADVAAYVGQALDSANDAEAAKVAAEAAANSVALIYDNFDDRYLGSKSADPVVDNDGNPLIPGALYYNSVQLVMKAYDGSDWVNVTSRSVNTVVTYTYTATAGQTLFTGNDLSGNSMVFSDPSYLVMLNGVLLTRTSDYTAPDSYKIVLTTGASAGDTLTVVSFSSYQAPSALISGIVMPEEFGSTSSGDQKVALEASFAAAVASGASVFLQAGKTYSVSSLTVPNGTKIISNGATIRTLVGLTGDTPSITIGNDVSIDNAFVSSPGTEANTIGIQIGDRFTCNLFVYTADTNRTGSGINSPGERVRIDKLVTKNIDRPIHFDNSASPTPTSGSVIGYLYVDTYVRGFRATNCDKWVVKGYRMFNRSPNSENTAVGTGSLAGSNLTVSTTERGTWYSASGGGSRIYNTNGEFIGTISGSAVGGVYPLTGVTGATLIGGVIWGRRMNDRVGHNGFLITESQEWEIGDGYIHQSGEHGIRVAGETRASKNGKIGFLTAVLTGGCALKVNPYNAYRASDFEVAGINGIDVGDTTASGAGDNKEIVRLSHCDRVTIGPVTASAITQTTSGQFLVKLNDVDNVRIAGLHGKANAGVIFDQTSDEDAPNRFAGPVTNVTIDNYSAELSGSWGSAVSVAMGTNNVGNISIRFNGNKGYTTNLLTFSGTPTMVGPITLSGVAGGPMTINNPPAGADIRYNMSPQTATSVATTSGTSKDFTGIPAGVKKIVVALSGVSTNSTGSPLVQLGSGTLTTSGYVSGSGRTAQGASAYSAATNGFNAYTGAAVSAFSGTFTLVHLGGNVWSCSHAGLDTQGAGVQGGGTVTLSGFLDRIRLTTTTGTDTFDAGSVNILYE